MNTSKTPKCKPSHFCGKFACLGKPWCTEWQSCNFPTPVTESTKNAVPKFENETKKETKVQRFAIPKLDKEVNEIRATAIPKKTKEDTEYCMRIWNAWWKERIASYNESSDKVASEVAQIMFLIQMNKKTMQHWLTLFVLEVRKQNGMEYPPM